MTSFFFRFFFSPSALLVLAAAGFLLPSACPPVPQSCSPVGLLVVGSGVAGAGTGVEDLGVGLPLRVLPSPLSELRTDKPIPEDGDVASAFGGVAGGVYGTIGYPKKS
jgi:hypothetical protein